MIATLFTNVARAPGSPIGDTITLIVWTVLAIVALRLVWRLPRAHRGAWIVVAFYCSVVAVDKAIDLQMIFYRFVQWSVVALDPWFALHQHRSLVRVLLLVPLTTIAVSGTIWLVRHDRRLDHGKMLAIGGLVLVLLLVGLRLLPGFGAIDETVGWVIEGVACVMIIWGLRIGFGAADPVKTVAA